MQTFKIFFNYFNTWLSYKDDDHFDIEFLSLSAAKRVVDDLTKIDRESYLYPPKGRDLWYIVDSNGVRYNLFERT